MVYPTYFENRSGKHLCTYLIQLINATVVNYVGGGAYLFELTGGVA